MEEKNQVIHIPLLNLTFKNKLKGKTIHISPSNITRNLFPFIIIIIITTPTTTTTTTTIIYLFIYHLLKIFKSDPMHVGIACWNSGLTCRDVSERVRVFDMIRMLLESDGTS